MLFYFCWEKVQNQELSGVYLTNSGKNQEQLKIRKNKENQESLDRLHIVVLCTPRLCEIRIHNFSGDRY